MNKEKKHDCYSCKGDNLESMPFINSEFKGTNFRCVDCGHEMTRFQPRCPERQRRMNENLSALREVVTKDKDQSK